jgi:ABC-2 type transport system ATP-binding protein
MDATTDGVPYAIETQCLSKSYGNVRAVGGMDLRVRPGEIYGFVGLNGAGKTTTIRLLLGMLRPTVGTVRILRQPVGPRGAGPWSRVGHFVGSAAAYPDLTVRENLEIARRLQGLRSARATDGAIDLFGLAPYVDRKAGALSSGNLQRLCLARAMLHDPELLILDEPTNGLDPSGVVEVRELLRSLARSRGVTIFMSSHILTEVDRLATRIGIIHRGTLIEELDAHSLEQLRLSRLQVQVRDMVAARQALERAGFVAQDEDGMLVIADARAVESPDQIASLLVHAGASPVRLLVVQEDLEDHFMRLIGRTG